MKEKLKTVDIKGKKYVEVAERVRYFNEAYPKGYITTEIISHENGLILMKAVIIPDVDSPTRRFTGYAQEEKGKGLVNTLSYIENCETSAVGRALGFLGIGVETSIRSADEMKNVSLQNEKPAIKEPEAFPEAISAPVTNTEKAHNGTEQPELSDLPPEADMTSPKPLQQRFKDAYAVLGKEQYFLILSKYGVKSTSEIKKEEEAHKVIAALENAVELQEFADEGSI